MMNAAKLVFVTQLRTIPSATVSHANMRRLWCYANQDPHLDKFFKEKRSLRSKIRRDLKNMDPILRSQQDDAIQRVVLEAPWFKTSGSICAYISSDALREVDTSRIVSNILSNTATDQEKALCTTCGGQK